MSRLRILLVDDSPSIRQFVSAQLLDNGYDVCSVASGEAAIEVLADFSPELLLIDLEMPGIGGLETIRRLRKRLRQWVPVIVITGSSDEADLLMAFGAGADDYLLKPLNPLKLDVRIRALARISMIQRAKDAIVETMLDGVIQIDRAGGILAVNRAAADIFQYAPDDLLGRNIRCLMPSPDREQHDAYIGNYMATGQAKIIGIGREVVGQRRDGTIFPLHLGISEAETPGGGCFIGVVRDLTEEKRLLASVRHLAETDTLTALPNRLATLKHLQHRADEHIPCLVMFCDLDGFKKVNDTAGHAVGDLVLQEAARRMQAVFFKRDFVGRVGGDEFLAIIDGRPSAEQVNDVAQRLIDQISVPFMIHGEQYSIGVSIGIARSDMVASVDQLIEHADKAMYEVKKMGGARIAYAT